MNDLFWSLYLIDVIGSFYGALWATLLATVIAGFFGSLKADIEEVTDQTSSQDDNKARMRGAVKWAKRVAPVVFAIGLFAPTKDTMYMMLAVRMTDNVMQSDTGQKLMNVLRKKLDAYINEIDAPKKEK